MKYTICISILIISIFASPSFAGDTYKAGWTYSALAKMKLSCTRGISLVALSSVGGSNDDAVGNKTLSKSEKNEQIKEQINSAFSFCNCTWDKIASDYSLKEYKKKSKGKSSKQMEKFIFDKYSGGECGNPH